MERLDKLQTATIKDIVAPSSNASRTLRDFFLESLKDIYWAENRLISALPKMAENAAAASLSGAIFMHLAVTKNQVARLERVFDLLGEQLEEKKCEALAGLLKEGENILAETEHGAVRDAAIIAVSQKIEHYEIATYGTLKAYAKTLAENDVAKLLAQTLAEEKEADHLLNEVAINLVNSVATE